MPQLLTNSSATGASTPVVWGGGNGEFEAYGTFNGATLTLQTRNGDGTFSDVSGTALTASGKATFSLTPGQIRVNVTAAAPTSVSAAAWRRRGSTNGSSGTGGAVSSVAGKTGDVTLARADLTDDASLESALASIPSQALQVHAVPQSGGNWDASTNSPTITSGTAPTDNIYCRTVTVAGATTVDGESTWNARDTITWNGTTWYRTAALPVGPGLVTTDASGNPGVLAGGSVTEIVGVTSAGAPTLLKIGQDVGAPITAILNQPIGLPPSGSTVGANGGALTIATAFLETYGPTGATPYDGIWLKFNTGEVYAASPAGFYWCVMTSVTAGTVYQEFLAAGSSALNKPPAQATPFTTNAGSTTTGTTAQILGWTIPTAVPVGYIGANGVVEYSFSQRSNASAGAKTIQPKMIANAVGGNVGTALVSTSTSTNVEMTGEIYNKNNASRQSWRVKSTTSTVSVTLAPGTSAAPTAGFTTSLGFDLKTATATDWVVCQFATFKVFPVA